ncbi:hypothetical protein ACPYO6_08070 [Georgenia sp. Z1344]|uniref:hypothetical protein n=1 Tax=Georgenia sp. Z1344 TaxID=3416706 RepID=UPI003CF96445
MRRKRRDIGGVPARLLVFDPADWAGRSWRDRFDAWRSSLEEFDAEHGWPAGRLDMFYRTVMTRQLHERRALHRGVTEHFGLPPER